jgi:hypothetical protein
MTLGDERRWFVPYYIDVGAGNDSNTTWQAYAGAGYRYDWGDLVFVYRWTSDSSQVENVHTGTRLSRCVPRVAPSEHNPPMIHEASRKHVS